MKKFCIGEYDREIVCDDDWWDKVLGRILQKFQSFNTHWNMSIQLPHKMGTEEVIRETKIKKTLFGKEKIVEIKAYPLYLYFHNDLSKEDVALWNMFILGLRAGTFF